MFEKLKDINFKTFFKFAGLGFMGLIFIMFAIGIISFIFNSINLNFGSSRNIAQYGGQLKSSEGITMGYDSVSPQSSDAGLMNSNVGVQNTEIKSYSANIDSANVEKDCNSLVATSRAKNLKIDNIGQSKHSCNLTLRTEKGKEQEFIDILKKFNLTNLNTNISNIAKNYTNISDKIDTLKKRIKEIDTQLEMTKSSYDELWNALKNKGQSAENIDSLNKIIQNKMDFISRFSKEKETLADQISMLEKQKNEYNEQIKYVSFYVYFNEKIIFDMETIKNSWYYDYKEFIATTDETVRNLTVNLGSYLLKTINVTIYIVIGLFFILLGGKGIYKMGRRIIFGKENR
ncbi:MAG: hypothetical protein PHS92_04420 [Candidatus Gracilibacteria bacterium]|nr:hypothetical protein [Candidatus Gracilibacteria bacterium]